MADYLANAWENLLNLLKDNQQTIFKNPLVWIIFGLVVVGIYGLFDVPKKTSMNSLGNVVRKLIQTLLDTASDVINALGSLTGFLKVVENLLFGKLNKKTLFVLNNFAIIFLSMASFITTYNGLDEVLNWVVAAFVSFGIQVSILILCIEISRCHRYIKKNDKKKKKEKVSGYEEVSKEFPVTDKKAKEVVRVTYKFSLPADDYIVKKSLAIGSEQQASHSGESQKEDKIKENEEKRESEVKRKKRKRNWMILLLAASVVVSSSFSYLFMFEKFVKRQLPYDDHFRSIETVQIIIKDYSEKLRTYRDGLVEILSTYNDRVAEWMRLQENNPRDLENEIEEKENELKELEGEKKKLGDQKDATDDPEEEGDLESQINTIDNNINEAETNLEPLLQQQKDPVHSCRLDAYDSIMELARLYLNPLYIEEVGKNEIEDFFSKLIQAEAQYQDLSVRTEEHAEFTEGQRNQIKTIFGMYYELCIYYEEHGNDRAGIDFTVVESQLSMNYEDVSNAEDYQVKTNALLADMLGAINAVPVLSTVVSPWDNKNVTVPNQEAYLTDLYNLYRDNRGTATDFERAFNKLVGRNKEKATLSRLLWILALSFDLLIVWLTILRRKKHYMSELGDLRRLVGVLILDDSLEEASVSYRKSQGFCCVLGIVSGILVFLLYKMNYVNTSAGGSDDMFTFLVFCLLGLIAGLFINRLYTKVFLYKKNWDADNLYLLWKQIWLDSGKDENELRAHIKHLRESNDYETAQISGEGRKALEKYCADTQQQALFTKYVYQNVLDMFNGIEMKEVYKIIMIKTIHKNQLKGVDYVSEKLFMPCIEEKIVKEHKMQIQFNILVSRHLAEFDKGFYILTERFWCLLYDAILLCIVGGRISDHDIEEELAANGEDEEELY